MTNFLKIDESPAFIDKANNSFEIKGAKDPFDINIKGAKDPFDINMKTVELKPSVPHLEYVTSKILCTPGCGMTGTGNSFCC